GVIVTLARGAGMGFALVYLPALLLFNNLKNVELPGIPDVAAQTAAIYGILLASAPRIGERLGIRFNLMDGLVLVFWVAAVATALATEQVYPGVSTAGSHFLAYVAPYFLARVAFLSHELRRTILNVLMACTAVLTFFAFIEFRLW